MYADVSELSIVPSSKMEPTESSETSAYINTLTPGTYPKEKKLQTWKSLKFTLKYTKISLVHVSVNDHHQGACTEPD